MRYSKVLYHHIASKKNNHPFIIVFQQVIIFIQPTHSFAGLTDCLDVCHHIKVLIRSYRGLKLCKKHHVMQLNYCGFKLHLHQEIWNRLSSSFLVILSKDVMRACFWRVCAWDHCSSRLCVSNTQSWVTGSVLASPSVVITMCTYS